MLFLMAILVTLSCGISDTDEQKTSGAPEIIRVRWVVDERSNHPGSESSATAHITFYIYLDKPDRHSDITRIVVHSPYGSCWRWDSDDLADKWDQENRRFEMVYCYSTWHPNSVLLGTYIVEAWRIDADPQTLSFDVFGRTDTTLTAGYIYSYACSSLPKILKPPDDCSCSVDGDTLAISFKVDDDIVDGGLAWCYTSTGSYLGSTDYFEDVGTINRHGPNTFRLHISDMAAAPDEIRILLTASTPQNQGIYRARSIMLNTGRSPICEEP
jgi:hypothetical protein